MITTSDVRGMKYDAWLREVDDNLAMDWGLTSVDLPRYDYRDMYEGGYEAWQASNEIVEAEEARLEDMKMDIYEGSYDTLEESYL